ncbi:AraC family transcriptional regulator of adaptative response/methylated-DNA-[protein]-cysteine methyltransferase [Lewinella marina]|uniref:methylated-DNA--[protein]-cysteine S-methyltransferase n=1 Tax=Neolewinella marina TaxID=438751 RepID=A0A2G0CGL2_9BACT|nr:methylated-DNA--[protein]-cysteine S-methyltransferase [Neolewinella marina]NJB86483.1 AraC family transcriptional regulator of adaptative response/methylated-DNA-[protein]-cysteine methyltransferase [Neolewinella marina]PHK99057.1 6-O-methylguanine DNA methyltransferase [Neolewinella marina]
MPDPDTYDRIARAIHFIRSQQSAQPDLATIAAHVNLSKFHFQRLFSAWAGVSPKAYLQFLTTERARRALGSGHSTLSTSFASGLSGNARLHDHFIKVLACTPGEYRSGGAGLTLRHTTFSSPFGAALVAETDRGVCSLSFSDGTPDPESLRREFPRATVVAGTGQHSAAVIDFFTNWQRPPRPIGIDLRGTPFQLQVWRALLSIPAGELRTYGAVAEHIGQPTASRAVGTAIGRNPVAYLIPCHRVIRSDGALGGYRWGPDRKVVINDWEKLRHNQ